MALSLWNEDAGSHGSRGFTVKGAFYTALSGAVPVDICSSTVEGALNPTVTVIVCRVDYGQFDWCEGIPRCAFDLHVSNNSPYCACLWVLFFKIL